MGDPVTVVELVPNPLQDLLEPGWEREMARWLRQELRDYRNRPVDIDDAVSVARVDLLTRWGSTPGAAYDPDDPARQKNFARKRARHTARGFLKAEHDRGQVQTELLPEHDRAAPTARPGRSENSRLALLRYFLTTLDEKQRVVVWAIFYSGASLREAAPLIGVRSQTTVVKHRDKALQHLRACLLLWGCTA